MTAVRYSTLQFQPRRADSFSVDWDIVTPSVDGTILPGVTRHSCIELTGAHGSDVSLYGLPSNLKLHPHERDITYSELEEAYTAGKLLEVFVVGTAVVVASVERIGAYTTAIQSPVIAGTAHRRGAST